MESAFGGERSDATVPVVAHPEAESGVFVDVEQVEGSLDVDFDVDRLVFMFTWMWTVSSLFLNSRGVHFGRCGRLRDKASMPSGFPIDSRVPVTVFEVPGREGSDDIDACATAYQAVKTAIFQRKHIVVPLWGGVGVINQDAG
ncbi:MAG: hypothetical protein PUF51_04490 [Bifidobacteriaceae bacterium]|nr:hypothetical protein [Bifidobacteriaceae bacterium]